MRTAAEERPAASRRVPRAPRLAPTARTRGSSITRDNDASLPLELSKWHRRGPGHLSPCAGAMQRSATGRPPPARARRAVTIKGSDAQLKGAAAGAEKWTTGYGGSDTTTNATGARTL
ncbi:hypothetical protein HPB50_008049 [Hyalomma asiaticum]|uniref:Uncharacterized protein n=1 Tax=Hyalomma asiaticum TaxID=266040 RepID=A0ACB7TH60_HYAAI|nr:hypothetical protein HPB50_008049 [Hyalomma asiaticum]